MTALYKLRPRLFSRGETPQERVAKVEATYNEILEIIIDELENLPVGLFDSTPYRDKRIAQLRKNIK